MGVRREMSVGRKSIVIEEMEEVCDAETGRVLTGSWVWESAIILSEWMTAQREMDLRGKKVLELGAGAGLPGLTAAMLGANHVLLTDVEPLIKALVRNVEANGLGNVVKVRKLVWGRDESPGEFDLVLMSDVLFDPEQMGALAQTLKSVCGDHTRVWAATEVRPWTGDCLAVLADQGFGIVELPALGLSASDLKLIGSFAVFSLVPINGAGHVSPTL
ncbi:protein N-lysine methyltransferase METTL21A-like [Abrus precatorius]|uniref:Protein N-lysine methyltransferase METTL21A-like n=1 Tax=Abrus precatorius TaxID=3816 RepID=A0A8B8M0K5_ABRPR|nr:protein N-lysine methyltransferase METTL21A-like [Abrus precatorius]